MVHLLSPPVVEARDQSLAARQLFAILWILMLAGAVSLAVAAAIGETSPGGVLVIGMAESAGIVLLVLNGKGRIRLTSRLLMAALWLAATGLVLTGGMDATAMAFYLLAVLVAGFVQGIAAGIATAAFCIASGLLLAYAGHAGFLPSGRIPHTSPLTLWMANATCMTVVVALQVIIVRNIREALKKSQWELKERQTAHAALKASEERYRSIFDNAREGIFQSTPDGRFIKVNRAMARTCGYDSPEEMLNEITDIARQIYIDPRGREAFKAAIEKQGTVRDFQHEVKRRDGSRIWISLNARAVRDGDGRIVYYEGTHEDITERKHMEDALRESRELYRGISECSHTAICIVNEEGRIVWVNRKMIEIGGYREEEFYGAESFVRFLAPDSVAFSVDNFNRFLTGKPYEHHYIFHFVRKDSEKRVCEKYLADFKDKHNRRHLIINMMDITESIRDEEERKSMEDRLRRAEKMEALGILAGGVAHDLNNILGVLSGYAEMLLSDDICTGSPSLREYVENIVQSGERAATVVQDLLTLARRGAAATRIVDLNTIVGNYFRSPEHENLMSHHLGTRLKVELASEPLPIRGSSVHLMKTLMNLVSNAMEAMPTGGELTVRTDNRYLDRPVRGYDDVKRGDYAVLSVSDRGEGIPARDLKRIFEPFYTKKVMGRSGTGLGLTVVWGTVKDHNGYIDVASEEGRGTTFSLYFPATQEKAEETPVLPAPEYRGRGESILVVDDVQGQRDLATRILTRLNYKVASVASGEEAVEFLKSKPCDLLVLDMIMDPGMDGLDTYRRIVAAVPRQKAILVSGYAETERVAKAQAYGAGAYVRKPYMMERLAREVRKELDRPA